MPRQPGVWIPLIVIFALFSGLALTLDGQTDPEAEPAAADAAIDLDSVMAMSRDQRFEAIRAQPRDQRISLLRQLSREERQAYRTWGRDESVGVPAPAGYQQPLAEPRPAAQRPFKVAGTSIQYDSGTVTGHAVGSGLGLFIGNRYDSALNPAGTAIVPVEHTGTITMLTFEMLRTFSSTVTWSLYSDITGTSAMQVHSRIIPAAVGLNTHTVNPTVTPNVYQNGSFLAGVWQFATMFTRVGMDTVTTGGQGFHAVSINEPQTANPNTGMGLMTLGSRNIVFRISGNLVTPIELMNFEIE